MKKVLHIVTRLDVGGISSLIYNYYLQMFKSELQFEIVAVDTGYKHVHHNKFQKLGIPVYYMPDNLGGRISFLYNLLRTKQYYAVHSHVELPSAIYLTIAKLVGVKVRIAHAHLAVENIGLKNRMLSTLLNLVVSQRVGASNNAISSLFGKRYIPHAVIIKNAIRVSDYSFDSKTREKLREEFNIEDDLVLGFVGRLTYLKNPFFLLKILEETIKVNDRAMLIVVGDGELKREFLNKAIEKNLDNNMILLGNREDVNNILMAMDVLLLPSFKEGLGMVLIEAQAAALKCIANTSGIPAEAKISSYLHFEDIENGPKSWANIIVEKCINYSRSSTVEEITNNKYNIVTEVRHFENLYR